MRRRIGEFLERAYAMRTVHIADDPRASRIHVQIGGLGGTAPFSLWVPLTRFGFANVHRLCEQARLAAERASNHDAQPTI
jgi:hypothetical protein